MIKSEMKIIVEELISSLKESSLTIRELSEKTGVSENVIKKLSNKSRTIDKTLFENVEKLYFYALEILKMKSFVSLHMESKTDFIPEIDDINFNGFETISINIYAGKNKVIELPFADFSLDIFTDDKIKFNISVQNAMADTEYSVDYINSLNLNECKKAEIVFIDAGSEQIKLPLAINFIDITVEEIEDENEEFRKMMELIADENDEIFKGLVDK